jgi:lysophospholipase L1-like esterase
MRVSARSLHVVRLVALAGLGAFAALASLEILVRWVAPQPLQHIELDDTLYFVNRPLKRFVYGRGDEYRIEVSYNAWGFRGPIPDANLAPGTTRVLLLGDSQTEGLQVRYEQTYGSVLRDELERRLAGRRFQVVNLAVSAYGTHQQILTLRRYGARLKPHWVVLGFYPSNDVQDNMRLPLISVSGNDARLVEHRFSRSHRLFLGTKIWLGSVSHLYVLTMSSLKEIFSKEFLARLGIIEPLRGAETREDESVSLYRSGPFSAGMSRYLATTERLLTLARAEACQLDARFVILIIPARIQVNPESWERRRNELGLSPDGDDLDRPEIEFAARFDRAGLFHVEALAPLRRAQQSGARPFFQVDGHLNSTGHLVVGQTLARWLVPHLEPGENGPSGC